MAAKQYIEQLGRFSGKAGLHRIKALLQAVGNPQKKLKFVHIAGTNGKGSTAAMLAGMVRAAGYHVGVFTSPYLVHFHERIRIDEALISEEALERLTQVVQQALEKLDLPEGESIGQFEFITAVGLLYFAENPCDLVILEAGLGGEFDATNVIDAPVAAVLTSISLDHTQVLGENVEQIAKAKTGIIKASSKVVIMPHQPEEAFRVITRACRAAGDTLIVPGEPEQVQCTLQGTDFVYRGLSYHMQLLGRHQLNNALTAIHTIDILRQAGFTITDSNMQQGLQNARLMGRLEIASQNPLILLDGAHNPDGIAALGAALEELLAGRQLFAIMGMVEDKEVATCVQAIAQHADKLFAVTPQDRRGLPSAALAELGRQTGTATTDCGNLAQALTAACAQATPDTCILVCGSLYLVGECEKILQSATKTTK